MSTLAITSNWTPIWYGFGSNEAPKYIKILTKLPFIWEIGNYASSDSFNSVNYLNEAIQRIKVMDHSEETLKKKIYLNISLIRGFYIYKSRMFAIPNKSFEQFIKKVKIRYKNKLSKKRYIKNILNRQLYGKFIHK